MKRFLAFYSILPSILMVTVLAFGFAMPSAAAPGIYGTENVVFHVPMDAPDPNLTLRLVNEIRTERGYSALHADANLAMVAQQRADDMVARQFYAHKNPDGEYYFDYFKSNNVIAGYNCENLDLVFVPSQDRVIDEWMSSMRGHKECMLSANVTHAGYATAKLTLVNFDQSETTAYLVVAVHAFLHK